MPFDPSSLWDASHAVTFLGGAAIGAAGTYYADKSTDRRREKEAKKTAKAAFDRLLNLMPSLFAELRDDLAKNRQLLLREVVILPNERLTFNHDKPMIRINETQHPAAKNQFAILTNEQFVEVVRSGSFPIYMLTERFVESLERNT